MKIIMQYIYILFFIDLIHIMWLFRKLLYSLIFLKWFFFLWGKNWRHCHRIKKMFTVVTDENFSKQVINKDAIWSQIVELILDY